MTENNSTTTEAAKVDPQSYTIDYESYVDYVRANGLKDFQEGDELEPGAEISGRYANREDAIRDVRTYFEPELSDDEYDLDGAAGELIDSDVWNGRQFWWIQFSPEDDLATLMAEYKRDQDDQDD